VPTVTEIACLMYHEVTDEPAATGFQRPGAFAYKHSTAVFTEHLARIAETPVRPSLVTDLDLTRPGRHVLLTFDDGGKSALTAGELLDKRGWKGHFFIVTSLIGSRTFIDPDGIRALHSAGHVIGSHSHTHPNIFRELEPARMLEEWRLSSDILSQVTGAPCVSASVPGGDISARVLASADSAGLRYLFTSEPWLIPRRSGDCAILGRYSVKVTTSAAQVGALTRFHGWRTALLRRRLKVWATRALPPLYRLYIRARTTRSADASIASDRSRSPSR
jgi:peptidoglycan/xylan/chitin deacetylase (PgdA/CDA1 family)